jgi:hypothetical protein
VNRGEFADTDTVNSETSPCRLYVYPARDAPLAAVLRRGPSAWTRLSLWHTDTDEIEHGQWFAARVYERRCGLSPDGRLFAYFARKDSATTVADVGAESWIAVSRPPWFTALALWAIGSTWCAGAYFDDARTLFAAHIESPPDKGELPAWLALTKTPHFQDRTTDWTDRTVFFSRLLRDGWTPVPEASAANPWWERRSRDDRWTLIMMPRHDASFSDYGGRHTTDYALRDHSDGSVRDLGEATWAGWDRRGRLALARDGKLVAGAAAGELAVVADFNDQQPQPAPSPPVARIWP